MYVRMQVYVQRDIYITKTLHNLFTIVQGEYSPGVNSVSPIVGFGIIPGACTDGATGIIPSAGTNGTLDFKIAQISSGQSVTQQIVFLPTPKGVE